MEAVGQLTGGIAHDFNNLPAGISGSLDMMQTRLQQGRIGDLDRDMVDAQGAAKRASALTYEAIGGEPRIASGVRHNHDLCWLYYGVGAEQHISAGFANIETNACL
jgi:signal transduction histidine kinase